MRSCLAGPAKEKMADSKASAAVAAVKALDISDAAAPGKPGQTSKRGKASSSPAQSSSRKSSSAVRGPSPAKQTVFARTTAALRHPKRNKAKSKSKKSEADDAGKAGDEDGAEDDDWNAAYEAEATRVTMLHRVTHDAHHSEGSLIKKTKKNKMDSVNGYKVGSVLGKGAFGEVFLASKGDERLALKVLKKSTLKKQRQGKDGSALDAVKLEIATMKKIAHPNCVRMVRAVRAATSMRAAASRPKLSVTHARAWSVCGQVDVIVDEEHDEICLLLEYVDGGCSQPSDAEGNPVPLAHHTIWSHFRHLLIGLEYLHMHNIVHRDIKVGSSRTLPELRTPTAAHCRPLPPIAAECCSLRFVCPARAQPENLLLTRSGVLKIGARAAAAPRACTAPCRARC
jgi:hypothetical protein